MSDREADDAAGKQPVPPRPSSSESNDSMIEQGFSDAGVDPVVQAHIGRELRSLFDEIVHQPVPDRFLELLQSLEKKTAGKT